MDECPKDTYDFAIYMGKSLDALNSRSVNFPSEKIKRLPVLKLSKCCGKLLDEAKTSYEIGDQEMAYVKYSRYFIIIRIIRDSCQYEKYKDKINEVLGSVEDQTECVNRIKMLTNSLELRYKKLAAEEKKSNQSIKLHNPYKLSTKSKPSAYFSSDALSQTKCQDDQLIDSMGLWYFTCDQFYIIINNSLFEKGQPKEIIIDCRPHKDFYASRIAHRCVINIDEENIHLGVTAAQIARTLTEREQKIWDIRGIVQNVIIIDWHTIEDEPIHDSPLHILMSILNYWDPDVIYPSLKFLKGGYAEFLNRYPKYTTNSNIIPPPRICPAKDEIIEYPSVAAIPMKEELGNVYLKSVPVTNCETDPNSLKRFNTKIIKEMVEQREELADKSISLEKKRYVLEEKIKAALNEPKCAQDEQTQEEAIEKVNQTIYEIMELENSIHDISEKSLIVSEQINEQQASVPDAIPIDKIKQIEKKECEAQKLNKINEQLAQSETREITPIKSLVIDQSILPKMPYNIQEELNPIAPKNYEVVNRGITGLKNMGYTCYMNCIFQCISNTNSLTICFINKVYRKYMTNSDAPETLIVEHVANLVRALWSGKYTKLTPIAVFHTFSKVYDHFKFDRPNDAHEFLDMLLETLHSALSVMPYQASSHIGSSAEKAWMEYINCNKESLITDLFYGQMKTIQKCTLCNHEYKPQYVPFTFIGVPILKGQKGHYCQQTLADCLNQYFGGKREDSKLCEKCRKPKGVISKRNIVRLPSVLVFHFGRYQSCEGNVKRIDACVDFPIKNLQMNDYVAPSVRNSQNNHTLNGEYKLYAVVNHYESRGIAHYTAYCHNVILKRWFHFDDAKVTALIESEVVSSAALLLFYSKLPESEPPEIT